MAVNNAESNYEYQILENFSMPEGSRGRSLFVIQLWWIIQGTFFGLSPQFMYAWRVFLLRLFGAKIGKQVIIRPTVKVTYPWKVTVGDYSWIGDNVILYSLDEIKIADRVVISQGSYICTGSHDIASRNFDLLTDPVIIQSKAWIAAHVFVAPGVVIGEGCVVGARSSVFNDLPARMVCFGNPAQPVRSRIIE